MTRLVVLLGAPAAALAGVAIGGFAEWAAAPLLPESAEESAEAATDGGGERRKRGWTPAGRVAQLVTAAVACWVAAPKVRSFYRSSDEQARYHLSHPQILFKDGRGGLIDDYREAYWWVRDNTPTDARVLSWWDYGYQISGIAKRTTLADGNTWNHEHIALLGLVLTAPPDVAHALARHLADYILVWTGGGSDDLGKSGHMARIATSVFGGHCAESDCNAFGVYGNGHPSPSMAASLIYRLCGSSFGGPEELFREVYVSSHGKVRVVQVLGVDDASRRWAADPAHRECDAPGSWYCPGRYPPQLQRLVDAAGRRPAGSAPAAVPEGDMRARRRPARAGDDAEVAEFRRAFRRRAAALREALPKPMAPGSRRART